jgi:hypothetical protein
MTLSDTKLREGGWFAVPLGDRGYVVGCIARSAKRGGALFGYFFGPLRPERPVLADLMELCPADAVFVTRFMDEPLITGRWTYLGSSPTWDRMRWPMPEFHLPEAFALGGESQAVTYADDDPERFISYRIIPQSAEKRLPPDLGVLPPEDVERFLLRAFGLAHSLAAGEDHNPAEAKSVRHFLLVPPAVVHRVRRRLDELGFQETEVLAGDFEDLVSVVIHDVRTCRGGNVDEIEATLSLVAESVSGRYDGTEWIVVDEDRV